MRPFLIVTAAVFTVGAAAFALTYRSTVGGEVQAAEPPAEAGSFYALETRTLEGDPASLSDFEGRVALVVNVASKCGLTPQYEGLEALHREFSDRGFTVLGFPSNDFMNQEPGSPEEILAFCSDTYGVTFPMFEKVHVKGDAQDPVYQHLTRELEEPTWNFTKYLVDRDGRVLYRFPPRTAPDDTDLRAKIEQALAG
jgi:glutathione peroxidase